MSFKKLAPSFLGRLETTKRNIGSGGTLMDVGCGDGEYDRELSGRFERIDGVDINEERLSYASLHKKHNCFYWHESADKMHFMDGTFDKAICVDIIEHTNCAGDIVKEIARVMKKGGTLFLSTPNKQFPISYDPVNWVLKHFSRHIKIGIHGFGHERLYSDLELKELLENNGFRVEKINYVNHFLIGLECYLSSIFGYFLVKRADKNPNREEKDPPKFIIDMIKACLWLDEKLFGWSKTSIGIMVLARKI